MSKNPTRLNPAEIIAAYPAAPLLTWEQIASAIAVTWAPAHAYLVSLVDQANRAAMREWIMRESAYDTGAQDALLAIADDAEVCADHLARLDADGWRRVVSAFIEACEVYIQEAYPLLDEDLHGKMEWEIYTDNMISAAECEIRRLYWPLDVDTPAEKVGALVSAVCDVYDDLNSSGETYYEAPGDPGPKWEILNKAAKQINDEAWDSAVDLTYHGLDTPSTFQGAGTALTQYTHVQVGIGDAPRSALLDAIENCDAPDAARDAMQRQLDENWVTPWARLPRPEVTGDEDGELYCYASVRWIEV